MQRAAKSLRIGIHAWFPAIVLVLVGYVFEWLGFYKFWPSLDVPMHALGGALVAYAIHQIIQTAPKSVLPTNNIVKGLFVVSLTALVTIAWETYELLQDIFFGTVSQLGVVDALADMWIGIIAAAVYWIMRSR